ncbi:DUF2336 domain-containing protein [Ensifer soli]|uniref:DUF2336 domain-containing protein n=1 Tax=Ciceribacter sp. sgz301302 TaxID=3342379 RepID=UPI0035BA77A1
MIIQAFLRWVESAKVSDRARAAMALAGAYATEDMVMLDRGAAEMAMTFLLDDPSPKVRRALAEALAACPHAPRSIILPLAEDQHEIAGPVVAASPVLADDDLVDLAARGSDETRALIAARRPLSRAVAAAIAEIGGEREILVLLDNSLASLSRGTLKRIGERLGHLAEVRSLLLGRDDLPCEARQHLVEAVGAALAGSGLVVATIGQRRVERVLREACDVAAVNLAGAAAHGDMAGLVEHLRASGRLTPAFLLHALCTGKVDFFAATIVNLSGIAERRVRSILNDGRVQAIRSLFEAAGLARDISALFAEAILLWRRESHSATGELTTSISAPLLQKLRHAGQHSAAATAVTDLVEKLVIAERRQATRDYAALAARNRLMIADDTVEAA